MPRQPLNPEQLIDGAQVRPRIGFARVDRFHKISSSVAEATEVRDTPVFSMVVHWDF